MRGQHGDVVHILREGYGPESAGIGAWVLRRPDGTFGTITDSYLFRTWEPEVDPNATVTVGDDGEARWLRAEWMQTYTGGRFYPTNPSPDDVNLVDIAHALSMSCRYNGHVDRFYSVAEHCVLLSYAASPENALWALLHDAAEAYIGDMVRPLKVQMPQFRALDDLVTGAIMTRFGLPTTMPDEIRDLDTRILLDEKTELLGSSGEWSTTRGLQPLGVPIHGWEPEVAEPLYRERFEELFAIHSRNGASS